MFLKFLKKLYLRIEQDLKIIYSIVIHYLEKLYNWLTRVYEKKLSYERIVQLILFILLWRLLWKLKEKFFVLKEKIKKMFRK